jgi:2-dehydro-3-deoxyphosphogluconate aldolase/(4S)-4-hydroxy-2-oxoglutarate aldolase
VPVLTVDEADRAVPLVRALAAGGLTTVEITLRTPPALRAIRRLAEEVAEVVVGAGSVLDPEGLARAAEAGARFVVSPGFTMRLAEAAAAAGVPWLPGVATVSEAMRAREAGLRLLKLFPAELAGGIGFLDAVRGPMPDLLFFPTGGIGPENYRDYLSRSNVAAVGGSWMAPPSAIAAGAWARITASATELAA